MKKLLLFAAALALCGATSAQAAGINLAWGAGCWADNPENTRAFACTGNTGTNSFTGSFMPTADQPASDGSARSRSPLVSGAR